MSRLWVFAVPLALAAGPAFGASSFGWGHMQSGVTGLMLIQHRGTVYRGNVNRGGARFNSTNFQRDVSTNRNYTANRNVNVNRNANVNVNRNVNVHGGYYGPNWGGVAAGVAVGAGVAAMATSAAVASSTYYPPPPPYPYYYYPP